MPIPTPQAGEDQQAFVSRCMSAIGGEYDTDQTLGICFTQWRGKDKKQKDGEFVVEHAVPVLDEHEDIGPADLLEIIANNNRRIADTGDMPPIVLHHTPDDGLATNPIVGFARDFRMGRLGKENPRRCILADFHFFKDKYELAKEHPRRSVELWEKSRFIDPIALLSAETPARDLGLLFGKSNSEKSARYQLSDEEAEMAVELPLESVDELKTLITDIVKQVLAEAAPANQEPAPETLQKEEEPEEEEKEDKAKLSKQEKLRLERDQATAELAKFKKEHDENKKALDELQRKFRKTEREKELAQLRYEGFTFDTAEELAHVLDMDDDAYEKHKGIIKSRYQKAPVGVRPIPTARLDDVNGSTPEAGKEKAAKATKYAKRFKTKSERDAAYDRYMRGEVENE